MYNQCLECGATYPKGSSAVIQGCSECGNKRFSFTETPVSRKELREIRKKANQDMGVLMEELHKRNTKITRPEPEEKEGVATGQGSENWLKITLPTLPSVGSDSLGVERTKGEGGGADIDNTAKGIVTPTTIERDTGKDREEVGKRERKSEGGKREQKKAMLRVRKRRKIQQTVAGSASPSRHDPNEDAVEVVREEREGVYHIDLNRMLENMLNNVPVVRIEKGVYLINLPETSAELVSKKV